MPYERIFYEQVAILWKIMPDRPLAPMHKMGRLTIMKYKKAGINNNCT